jgi:hypothetical protein
MNDVRTNLLCALGCIQQAKQFAMKVENSVHIDDLMRESDECLILADNLLLAIDDLHEGCRDDIEAEQQGINYKPRVTYVDFKKERT